MNYIEAWEMVPIGIFGVWCLVRGIGYAIADWKGGRNVGPHTSKVAPAVGRVSDRSAHRDRDRIADRVG